MSAQYYGKYRGMVMDNADPMGLARLRIRVPSVPGVEELWALPCLPWLPHVRLSLPRDGSQVWVEFEEGRATQPVWCGWFLAGADEATPVNRAAGHAGLLLAAGEYSLTPGDGLDAAGLVLQGPDRQRISIDGDGIVLDNGQGASIVMRGPNVSINSGPVEIG